MLFPLPISFWLPTLFPSRLPLSMELPLALPFAFPLRLSRMPFPLPTDGLVTEPMMLESLGPLARSLRIEMVFAFSALLSLTTSLLLALLLPMELLCGVSDVL